MGMRVRSFLTMALDGGQWSASDPGHFTPGRTWETTEQEDGWTPEPVWIFLISLAPAATRTLDRPD